MPVRHLSIYLVEFFLIPRSPWMQVEKEIISNEMPRRQMLPSAQFLVVATFLARVIIGMDLLEYRFRCYLAKKKQSSVVAETRRRNH